MDEFLSNILIFCSLAMAKMNKYSLLQSTFTSQNISSAIRAAKKKLFNGMKLFLMIFNPNSYLINASNDTKEEIFEYDSCDD
ncbi:hypothetical protein BpHYR1_012926 [Brachionus plicatilis]|uniref:Uncharacterized protein n=1 Tax=Brachionus plicatilis TaxID=10195 RepID=A0A3M7P9F4_BRAPC|nr:hypothetical protein BpHYR1_012926 [Brachionus plicatilis]